MSLGPPTCKVCGQAHWGAAHVWRGEPQKPSALCLPRGGSQPDPVVVHKRKGDRHAKTEARKKYRREWTAKKRKNPE